MPADDRKDARVGTVLKGKYRLDAVLGAGGMAVVYRAVHRNRAEFAVKVLDSELSRRPAVAQSFLREGYVANSVRHPGAVRVVDDDVADDGAAFLVMELLHGMSGETLAAAHGGKLPVDVAVAIVLETLDVLVAAHRERIVHRDIKPANLFVTREGEVKVLDFGIARVAAALDSSTSGTPSSAGTRGPQGTPSYMSPEQARGSRSVDARSDVWCAGATLFSLLSGSTVHDAETGLKMLLAAANEPARPLASVAPHVPSAIAEVTDRALRFDKGDRWPSARSMRDALEAAWRTAGGPRGKELLARAVTGARPPDASVGDIGDAPTEGEPTEVQGPESMDVTSEPTSRSSRAVPVPRRGRVWLPLAAVAVLAGGAWAGVRALGNHERPATLAVASGPASAAPLRIAPGSRDVVVIILPFRNDSQDPVFDSGTLELILQSALSRSEVLAPMAGPYAREFISSAYDSNSAFDDDSLLAAARALGRPVLQVRGSVASDKGSFVVTVRLKDTTSGALSPPRTATSTTPDGVVHAVETLALDLRRELGEEPTLPPTSGMAHLVEADHAYALGLASMFARSPDEAIAHYARAVKLAPDFPLAHVTLGAALWSSRGAEEGTREVERGLAQPGGLSEHERLLARGALRMFQGDLEGAVEDERGVVQRWPSDIRALTVITVALAEEERADEALETCRREVVIGRRAVIPWSNLVLFEVIAGRFEEAVSDAERCIQEYGGRCDPWARPIAEALFGRGEEVAARYRRLDAPPSAVTLDVAGDVAAFDGRPKEAERILRAALDAPAGLEGEDRARLAALLAELRLDAHDLPGAIAAAERAAESEELVTRFRAARVLCRAHAPKKEQELRRMIGGRGGLRARLYARLLDAEEARARRAPADAIRAYVEARKVADSWLVHEGLAFAYFDANMPVDAARELDWCLAHTGRGAVAFPDYETATLHYLLPVMAARRKLTGTDAGAP